MNAPITTPRVPAHAAAKAKGESPNLLGLSAEADHWTVFKGLLPFVWPEGRPDLRFNVALAFVMLVLAKLVTIAIPVTFKYTTDWLTADAPNPNTLGAGHLAVGASMLIVAYGVGACILMAVFTQVRDVLFTQVAQQCRAPAQQPHIRASAPAVAALPPRAADRRPHRVIERGTPGVDLIIRMGVLKLCPTALELILRLPRLLCYYFDCGYRGDRAGDGRRLHVVHVRGAASGGSPSAAR